MLELVTKATEAVLASRDVRERYAQLGLIAEGGTAQDLTRRLEDDREYWARAVRRTGITLR
ncbi:hypothetical protein D3C78_1978460 [compost metagenome]